MTDKTGGQKKDGKEKLKRKSTEGVGEKKREKTNKKRR